MNRYLAAGTVVLIAAAAVAGWSLRGQIALASDERAFSESERAAIGETVREYLLANPTVLREVMEALDTYEETERAQQVAAAVVEHEDQLLQSPRDMVLGNPDGDVTLVEFFDYNCPYCSRALGDLAELMKTDPDLRVVLKEFPILSPGSAEAARVSMAAARQPELAWEFHAALLSSPGEANEARALRIAADVGLDMEKLAQDMKDPEIGPALQATQELAETIGVQGTPAYVVGNELVRGAIGVEGLREAIERRRQQL